MIPERLRDYDWSALEAFAIGRPDAANPDGVWLLRNRQPFQDFMTMRGMDAAAVIEEFRKHNIPQRDVVELKSQIDARWFDSLHEFTRDTFGNRADEVWRQLEACRAPRWPNVHSAILQLAHGDADKIPQLVDYAGRDYRDVLMWAQQNL